MCIFCERLKKKDFLYEDEHIYAIPDNYPVSKGHVLIITKRHIASIFDANPDEAASIHKACLKLKDMIDEQYHPDGYNIGVNQGEASGQTIMHLHVHLIPRYFRDVEDPRGGVRGVIPGKQSY